VKADTSGKITYSATLNNEVFFRGIDGTSGSELWETNGTDAGTSLVKDINSGTGSSSPEMFFVFNNTLYFTADDGTHGRELWKSDGTGSGTVIVRDINPSGDGIDPSNTTFITLNNSLYFAANDGTNGTELWKSDGTNSGTIMVKNINPSGSSDPSELTVYNSLIIFSANDGTNGEQPFRTDGTNGGTYALATIPQFTGFGPTQFTPLLGKVYFTVFSNTLKGQMWVTDGTTGGTALVKDFGSSNFPEISDAVVFGTKFIFPAVQSSDQELWSSDGTTSGTVIFDNINATGSSGAVILLDYFGAAFAGGDVHTRLLNGKIFFMADDGTHGTELWATDGTLGGTAMVKDVNPGSNSSINISSFSIWAYTGSGMYYGANDGSHGTELWFTDGTSVGTNMVQDINPGTAGSDPSILTFVNSHIFFTADNNSDGITDFYIITASVTLPSTLIGFTATLAGKVAQLQWTTATEINTKNFVVQRSVDATHFENIGTVNAVGNSTQRTSYQFADAGVFNTGANKIYYRLQMVDKDGRFAFSKIATLTIVNGKLFVVYPNPVKDQLIVTTNASLSKAEIRITDINGKIVFRQQIENMQAGSQSKVNVASLNKGVYYLQFINGSDVQSTKFIKE
jgi:ELWxxDGT repeat protein